MLALTFFKQVLVNSTKEGQGVLLSVENILEAPPLLNDDSLNFVLTVYFKFLNYMTMNILAAPGVF